MAKYSSSILELAARGARVRYEELQAELASLVRQFPDVRGGARNVVERGRRALKAAAREIQKAPRRRRKMSRAARAKIATAQRARWAKQKAASGAGGEGRPRTAIKK
jgi:hypothetical protein